MVSWILSAPEALHLVGRDLNSVMSLSVDRTSVQTRTPQKAYSPTADQTFLVQSIASIHSVDLW